MNLHFPSPIDLGFSFDDDRMPGKSKIQDHLEDLAQRHPEFAEQLKGWPDLERRETGTDRQREEEEKREEPGPLRSGNLRNTVPDMQSSSQSHDETDRGQRSQSAPPESSKLGPSGQFVSKVDISSKEGNPNCPPSSSSTASQEAPQQKVFHIPIYVEGRDEPIFPKEAMEGSNSYTKSNRKSTNKMSNDSQKDKKHKFHHSQHNQQSSSDATHPAQAPQPARSPPTPPSPSPAPAQRQQNPSEQQSTIIKDPLLQVALVLKEVDALKEKVDAFHGNSKKDKEYIYLDEMLTRNLLKLDNIDTDGKEEVRTARKEVIKRIQECITQLENSPSIGSRALVLVEEKEQEVDSCTSDTAEQPQHEDMEVPQHGPSA